MTTGSRKCNRLEIYRDMIYYYLKVKFEERS